LRATGGEIWLRSTKDVASPRLGGVKKPRLARRRGGRGKDESMKK